MIHQSGGKGSTAVLSPIPFRKLFGQGGREGGRSRENKGEEENKKDKKSASDKASEAFRKLEDDITRHGGRALGILVLQGARVERVP